MKGCQTPPIFQGRKQADKTINLQICISLQGKARCVFEDIGRQKSLKPWRITPGLEFAKLDFKIT